MSHRAAYYWFHRLQKPELAERFHLVECRGIDERSHRLVMPRRWCPISPLSTGVGGFTPVSLFVENPEIGERAGSVLVAESAAVPAEETARVLLTNMQLAPVDWRGDTTGGRGRAQSDAEAAMYRIICTAQNNLTLYCSAPIDRIRDLEVAYHNAIASFEAFGG